MFLLPVPSGATATEALPDETGCLQLEAVSRQRVSLRMDRLLITFQKVAEPEGPGGEVAEKETTPAQTPHRAQQREGVPGANQRRSGGRGSFGGDANVAPWDEWWKEPPSASRSIPRGRADSG